MKLPRNTLLWCVLIVCLTLLISTVPVVGRYGRDYRAHCGEFTRLRLVLSGHISLPQTEPD